MHPALMAGEIVDTMRNDHARGEAGEIMITRFERLVAVHFAIAGEGSPALFLLGIDAQDGVASLKKLWDHLGQMAELGAALRRVAARQHLGSLEPGKTKPIENPSYDAGCDTDGVFVKALGHFLGGQIRPHNVLAHGITCGVVLDRLLHLLGQVRVFDFRLFASTSGLADATSGRILEELLEFPHAVFDGLGIASQDLGDGAGAAMAKFDRFACRKASAIFFR